MGEDGVGDRIYALLKTDILSANLSVHTRLDIAELAVRYDVSTTPVREAIMRLLGEGLLEPHPKGGARPRFPSEFGLRALLDLHARFSMLAIESLGTTGVASRMRLDETRPDRTAVQLFASLAAALGNVEFEAVFGRLGDRLSPFRSLEPLVLTDLDVEAEGLYQATNNKLALKRAVRSYHRRREHIVPELIWLLASNDPHVRAAQ